MSAHAQIPPAFLAQLDQMRAQTESEVRELAEEFRQHADECHDGDPICSDAIVSMRMLQRHPFVAANLMGGAIGLIVKLDREIAELRRELGR